MSPSLVANLVRRTREVLLDHAEVLGPRERILSPNRVTGWSLNVPIAKTCQPTSVCAKSCYAAQGALSWPTSLRRQDRVQRTLDADPVAFAQRLCAEVDARSIDFVRWNGCGDLTPAAVEAINWIGAHRPDVTLWVVTRIPALASLIEDAPRVFVHFSLDAASARRREEFLRLGPRTTNYFFSYQAAQGEELLNPVAETVSVVFHHRYRVSLNTLEETSCPLNGRGAAPGACAACRRCFDGAAVAHRKTLDQGGPV